MNEREAPIRGARVEDADAIGALTIALTRRWIAADCSEAGLRHLLGWMAPARVRERLQAGHVCFVAESAGEIVGVATIRPPRHLYQLFVAESQQRRGLARRLWEAARARAIAIEGPGPVTVNASRYALPVYRRLGFVADGPERMEHGFPSTPMRFAEKPL